MNTISAENPIRANRVYARLPLNAQVALIESEATIIEAIDNLDQLRLKRVRSELFSARCDLVIAGRMFDADASASNRKRLFLAVARVVAASENVEKLQASIAAHRVRS